MYEENYIKQLADYIRKNLAKGYTLDSLKIALENQDYSKISIERAIDIVHEEMAKKAPKIKEKPVIRHEIIEEKTEEQKIPKKGFFKRLFE
jgi:SOS response regulatory protein OraA/RecX